MRPTTQKRKGWKKETRGGKNEVETIRGDPRNTDHGIQEFSLLLQAAPPSAGGCAAASAGGRGLSALK